MRNFIRNVLIIITLFCCTLSGVFALDSVKINKLIFDNSDNIIFIETKGETNNVTFNKGYLKDPDRVYLDINNAILTTPKKTYSAKYSAFDNIKISQFSTNPNTVRLVFEYNKGLDLAKFKVFKSDNSIFIKTAESFIKSPWYEVVYSNTKTADRSVFYNGAKFEEIAPIQASDLVQSDKTPVNEITKDLKTQNKPAVLKMASKYYLESVTKTKKGVLISGAGKISLMPAFTLANPNRLIIDLDDTIVSPDLRNKSFPIGEIQTNSSQTGAPTIDKRETIKIGQNSQNVARLVIQGENAKDYKSIVSPDSKSLYITKRQDIITAKMSNTSANLIKSGYSSKKDTDIISLSFDNPVSFNVFEENSNLYLDLDNLNIYQAGALDPVKRAILNLQTTRLATDKLRIIFPNFKQKHIIVQTPPDNNEIRIYAKQLPNPSPAVSNNSSKPASVYVPIETQKKKQQTVLTNLFTVVIDAGHGGSDVGATRNNIYEKDITLKISKALEACLKKKNVKVYMVRSTDKTVSLADRCAFSNEKRPDVFVSVHVNSSTNDTSYGVETHWYKEDSKTYANYVHKEMQKKIKSWKTNDRGLFKSQFYVINHTEAPAILCEIGFISNPAERAEIIKTKRQEEIAQAIADGIYNYLKAKK